MKKLSIVVPCYNEQETIYPFLEETQKIESKMKDQLIFDYIFINDGSKDETLKVLRDVASRFENVHYLSFSRNFGKEAGLLAGLEAADGDFITVMDADLQDPPELICIKKSTKVTMLWERVELIEKVNQLSVLSFQRCFTKSSMLFLIQRWLMVRVISV